MGDKADMLGLKLLQLKPGRDGKGREETWQRCITAERLRCRLLENAIFALRLSAEQQSSPPTALGATFGASPSLLLNATGQYANMVNAKHSRTNVANLLSANFDAAASLAAVAAASVPSSLPSFKPIMLDDEHISFPTSAPAPASASSAQAAVFGSVRREKDKVTGQHRLFIPRPDEAGGTTAHGVPFSYDRGCRVYSTPLHPHPLLPSESGTEEGAQTSPRRRRVRVVCLSDTHGMEAVLLDHVPDGDVLVHAGDWAPDHGRPTKQTRSFDSFLALLPHRHKIVVRGNHDPFTSDLRQSKAFYANRATTVTVDVEGVPIVFSLWPYGSLKPPEPGHIIVSHEPPHDILDETLRKNKSGVRKRAGSTGLLGGLDKGSASSVLVCGHIHESYGSLLHSPPDGDGAMGPAKRPPVLCVNACNANPGAAHSIVNLPTVIDLYI
jgi:predicted phosphodiesterase